MLFLSNEVRSSIKKIDQDDQRVKRLLLLYVINKMKPKVKQWQGWINYFVTIYFVGFSLLTLTGLFGLVFVAFLVNIFFLAKSLKVSI